jgi:hypothetical protein
MSWASRINRKGGEVIAHWERAQELRKLQVIRQASMQGNLGYRYQDKGRQVLPISTIPRLVFRISYTRER